MLDDLCREWLDRLERTFNKTKKMPTLDYMYFSASKKLRGCTVNVVEEFVKKENLAKYMKHPFFRDIGAFISALINKAEVEKIELPGNTGEGYEIHELCCYLNGGEITINGDAGHAVGYRMASGKVIVKGGVFDSLGREMSGGVVIVEGDTGYLVGYESTGGEIYIRGELPELEGDVKARVYKRNGEKWKLVNLYNL